LQLPIFNLKAKAKPHPIFNCKSWAYSSVG
jgi:hypothetical protein